MRPIDSPNGKIYIVGAKHIRALIGNYASPFITSVSAFWGFDANSNLIDIYVIKETDGF